MYGIYVRTYGCQMNVYDSGFMLSIMEPFGYKMVDRPDDADIVIINTCHIREKAAEKLYSELGVISEFKKRNNTTIVVSGCVSQAEGSEIFERAPYVDIVIGPQSLASLPSLIIQCQKEKQKLIDIEFPEVSKFDAVKNAVIPEAGKASAFLSIQEGCDKFCAFCVVPYTRGPEYSRPVLQIMDEARALADSGAKEIVLLGQNVNAYKASLDGEAVFLGELLSKVAKIDSVERISYATSHPMDMHESLYEAHLTEQKLIPYIHLPVQSGSDNVLKLMNRRHSASDYLQIINKLRKVKPGIAISGDFIVGFPGETDSDFEETLRLVREVKYAKAYSFAYSPRPGTPASNREQIDDSIKHSRLIKLQSLLKDQQGEFNSQFIGKSIPVLFDGKKGKYEGQLVGRSPYMQSVCVYGSTDLIGNIVNIKIDFTYPNCLVGSLINS